MLPLPNKCATSGTLLSPIPKRIAQSTLATIAAVATAAGAVRPGESGEISERAEYGWKMLGLVQSDGVVDAACSVVSLVRGILLGEAQYAPYVRSLQCPRCETARPWSEHARARQRHAHKAVLAWDGRSGPDTKNKRIWATNADDVIKRRAVISNMRKIAAWCQCQCMHRPRRGCQGVCPAGLRRRALLIPPPAVRTR